VRLQDLDLKLNRDYLVSNERKMWLEIAVALSLFWPGVQLLDHQKALGELTNQQRLETSTS
jgi:hypothetical protein